MADSMHKQVDDYSFPSVPVSVARNSDTVEPVPLTPAITPRTSELRTHSQTEPYLWHEPLQCITKQEMKQQFLRHLFSSNDVSVEWNLDLSDLRYDSNRPREAEGVVAQRLNKQILSSSQNIFIKWPSHTPPSGFHRDRRLDIATIRRDSYSVLQSLSVPVCPDVTEVRSCIEHTVTSGASGRKHNKTHAYAKINGLLKCPLNVSIIALGLHGSGMTLWYADRCGIIEVDLESDQFLHQQAVLGLSNLSTIRDPCVTVHRLKPHRIFKFTLHNNVYYGVYDSRGEPLYIADGIACRGTLVLLGLCATGYLDDEDAGFGKASDSEIVAIKLSHPSVPWAIEFLQQDNTADVWKHEWQVLQSLNANRVRNVPELFDHIEHASSTKTIRQTVGLQNKRHRTRTILVTRPLADLTLQKKIERGIELPELVQVMRDIIDAHQDAWQKCGIAHCDISPANIQIHSGQGILADWEFGTPVAQLSTYRAVNSGTLETMPPRLAFHKLYPDLSPPNLARTIWDEVCSIYLCFVSPLTKKIANQAHDVGSLRANLWLQADTISTGNTNMLLPQYQSNSTVVAAFKNAAGKVFQDRLWQSPPDDAGSQLWWDILRSILDSFVAG